MAIYSTIENFTPRPCKKLLKTAEQLRPALFSEEVMPANGGEVFGRELKRGDELLLDFGSYGVGRLTLSFESAGSHQDAPARIRLLFCEDLAETRLEPEKCQGSLGQGWVQEELLHLDSLPCTVSLPRRYAFRYVRVFGVDTSAKYRLVLTNAVCCRVSSADPEKAAKCHWRSERLAALDKASCQTLRWCMQEVFEDGPKRDRRLWLGDLLLQARTNYLTFQNNDLVMRCLYLFGGLTFNEGRIAACLFTDGTPEPDDTWLFDYALLYVPTLLEYWEATKDRETLRELYPVAMKQLNIALGLLDEDGIVIDRGDEFWCFLDWGEGLSKQAGAQGVLLYALQCGVRLAQAQNDPGRVVWLESWYAKLRRAAVAALWDEASGFFVSGPARQVSVVSQLWMVLADVLPVSESRKLLLHTLKSKLPVPMVTPYAHHFLVEALLHVGERELALQHLEDYWGEMLDAGAETFWEVFDPQDPHASPYGSQLLNSRCHGWSCTPAWFLRKYFTDKTTDGGV